MRHGTLSGYSYHGCRCADCREANRVHVTAWRRKRGVQPARGQQPLTHGTQSAYGRYGCRCADCREGNALRMRLWRERRRAAARRAA